MSTALLCSLLGLVFIQNGMAFPSRFYLDGRFDNVMKKLAEMKDGAESGREILRHVHEHVEEVEEKVEQNRELLLELRHRQKWLAVCKIDVNYCANGGSCFLDEETDDRACACTAEWQGPTCEDKVDVCANVECEHGGHCENGTCSCMEGFIGEFCQIGACAEKQAEYYAMALPPPGMEVPRCNDDGTYAAYQYAGSQAVCSTRGGVYLRAYSLDRWDPHHESMECECAIDEYHHFTRNSSENLAGFNCKHDGSFQ